MVAALVGLATGAAVVADPTTVETETSVPAAAVALAVVGVDPSVGRLDPVGAVTCTTLTLGDRVYVRRDLTSVMLIRLGEEGYYTRMRQKLNWGDLPEREIAR